MSAVLQSPAPPYEELGKEKVRELACKPKYWGWVEVDGNLMYEGGNDDMIVLRFLNGHTYEPTTRKLWKKCCSTAQVAVDVGTHSGIFTLDAYRAGTKLVMSIEPHPINYSRLVLNLRRNDFRADGAWLGAAGKTDAVQMMLVKEIRLVHAAGRVGLHNKNGIEIPVRVARMDSVIPKNQWKDIGVMKIDAENLTPDAIEGMPGILEHRPDLIIECTESGMGERLKGLGYKFWRIWEGGDIDPVDDLTPHNPDNNYNGTHENCRNRFASVKGLPYG